MRWKIRPFELTGYLLFRARSLSQPLHILYLLLYQLCLEVQLLLFQLLREQLRPELLLLLLGCCTHH